MKLLHSDRSRENARQFFKLLHPKCNLYDVIYRTAEGYVGFRLVQAESAAEAEARMEAYDAVTAVARRIYPY